MTPLSPAGKKSNLSTIPKNPNQSGIYVNTDGNNNNNAIYNATQTQKEKNINAASTNVKLHNLPDKLLPDNSFLSYSKKNESFENKNNIRVEFSATLQDNKIKIKTDNNIIIDKGPISSISSIEPTNNPYNYSPDVILRESMKKEIKLLSSKSVSLADEREVNFASNFISPIKIKNDEPDVIQSGPELGKINTNLIKTNIRTSINLNDRLSERKNSKTSNMLIIIYKFKYIVQY